MVKTEVTIKYIYCLKLEHGCTNHHHSLMPRWLSHKSKNILCCYIFFLFIYINKGHNDQYFLLYPHCSGHMQKRKYCLTIYFSQTTVINTIRRHNDCLKDVFSFLENVSFSKCCLFFNCRLNINRVFFLKPWQISALKCQFKKICAVHYNAHYH